MVDTVIDPIRIPSITLSQGEIEEIRGLIEVEMLPADYLERYYEAVRKNVFGFDHKSDAQGNPIEQGVGSANNQTLNSINAYRKYAKYEPGYNEDEFKANIKRMESELAASNKLRAAAKAAAEKKPAARLDGPRKDY